MADCDFFGKKNPKFEGMRSTSYGCDECSDRDECLKIWEKKAFDSIVSLSQRPRGWVKLCPMDGKTTMRRPKGKAYIECPRCGYRHHMRAK